jgi:hypothetical protein
MGVFDKKIDDKKMTKGLRDQSLRWASAGKANYFLPFLLSKYGKWYNRVGSTKAPPVIVFRVLAYLFYSISIGGGVVCTYRVRG